MNITEKKRAEEMVKDWCKDKAIAAKNSAISKATPTKAQLKEFNNAVAVLSRFKKDETLSVNGVNFYGVASLTISAKHPDNVKVGAEYVATLEALNDKADRLIVEVWDNKHTFESLAKELT